MVWIDNLDKAEKQDLEVLEYTTWRSGAIFQMLKVVDLVHHTLVGFEKDTQTKDTQLSPQRESYTLDWCNYPSPILINNKTRSIGDHNIPDTSCLQCTFSKEHEF